jgi:hypothetical protein
LDDNRSLYKLLLHSEVFKTDEITSRLEYIPTGATVVIDRSRLHVTEDARGFQIYIPKDKKGREICYLRTLPTKLLDQFFNGDTTAPQSLTDHALAITVISDILKSSDLVIDDVLEDAGIVTVPFADENRDQEFDLTGEEIPTRETSLEPSESVRSTSATGSQRVWDEDTLSSSGSSAGTSWRTRSSSPQPSYRTGFQAMPNAGAPRTSSIPRPSEPASGANIPRSSFTVDSREVEYLRLLNDVVNAARDKKGVFPTKSRFDLRSLFDSLPTDQDQGDAVNTYDMPFGVRSENQILHDMRVGAAGELYVSHPRHS